MFHIIELFSNDLQELFNTGYDALIVRKRGEIILGETNKSNGLEKELCKNCKLTFQGHY